MTKELSSKEVSELLFDVLRIASDFDAFCIDKYRSFYLRFGGGLDRTARHNLLLTEYAPEEVLEALRDYAPEKFAKSMRARESRRDFEPAGRPTPGSKPISTGPAEKKEPLPARPHLACFHVMADATSASDLRRHLGSLIQSELISYWDLKDLHFREPRDAQIKRQLETATALLFLVSADLLSDAAADHWIDVALKRQERAETTVIPILVRPVVMRGSRFEPLSSLPGSDKSIDQYSSRDLGWVKVTNELARSLLPGEVA